MRFGPERSSGSPSRRVPRRTFLRQTTLAGFSLGLFNGCASNPHQKRSGISAAVNPAWGQVEITENNKPVLRYNFAPIQPGEVLKSVTQDNLRYAVARSDYIHPLWGLEGEELTRDWSPDHPHHRGIYWAWPEVDWRGKRGDLHALQLVFARPFGACKVRRSSTFAEVTAQNRWVWETGEPIVHEVSVIRAHRATPDGRFIDLKFTFSALDRPVDLARRGTSHYGGLNIRLAAVKDQVLRKHIDPPGSAPRRAWSDLAGTFSGASGPSGMAVFQHASNPDYPGDWIEYPELNWLQPTFPAAGTRYRLEKSRELVLQYRLWIHPGARIEDAVFSKQWDAANAYRI